VFDCLVVVGHVNGPRDEVGDDAAEPALEATSYSARRQASEQYTLPSVCLSQARQKSGDQSISIVMLNVVVGCDGG
jgi:hypothetical protein